MADGKTTGLSMPGVFAARRTSDADGAVDMIKAIAKHRARLGILDPPAVWFDVRTATFGAYGSDLLRIDGVRYRAVGDPSAVLLGGVLIRGHGRYWNRERDVRLTAGDAFLQPVNIGYEAEYDNPAFALVRLPVPFVAAIAEQTLGIPAADLRFQSNVAVSPAMGVHWTRTVRFVAAQLAGREQDAPPALLVSELMRLAATASLVVFPNTAMTASHLPPGSRVAPASMRRAIAYIDSHAAEPITNADVVANAGIGARALQEAFRRHLDTTPTAYLRRVRLERAHRDLQVADPTNGATVSAIARRWGFAKQSRFAADYREVFGQLPSHTLRT